MEQRRKLILTVDDAANIRRLIHYNLTQAGYDVIEASSGEHAFNLLGGSRLPDLILLDIRMPGWDGFVFMEHLRVYARASQIPVIMLTALSTSVDIDHALRLGAVDYLVKPFDPPLLLSKVISVLRARVPTSMGSKDRRQFNRGDLHNVDLMPNPDGKGVDISESGIGFFTVRPMELGEVIEIKAPALFKLVGIQAFSLRARVAHVRVVDKEKYTKRVGTVFIGLTDANRRAIRRYALYGERPRDAKLEILSGGT